MTTAEHAKTHSVTLLNMIRKEAAALDEAHRNRNPKYPEDIPTPNERYRINTLHYLTRDYLELQR